jgi:hypothetical protein
MRGRISRSRRVAGGALALAFVLAAPMPVTAAHADSGNQQGFQYIGMLPTTGNAASSYVAATDPRTHTMYYLHFQPTESRWWLAYYRNTSGVPAIVRDVPLSREAIPSGWVPPPRRVAWDSRRNRLLIAAPAGSTTSTIVVFDLDQGRVLSVWSLNDGARLPAYDVEGITYSEDDDRIYTIGETVGSFYGENGFGVRPQVVSTVLAMNAADGSRAWAAPLTNCQQPLNVYNVGALIARSPKSEGLFVPCAQSVTEPRTSGLSKLIMGPDGGRADQQKALSFPSEFFPIAGRYQRENISGVLGEAVYDPGGDRIFIQSLSVSAPGTWVFDAGWSAWVGFVYSPHFSLDALAINPTTGHFYVSGPYGPFLVTDGRGTPMPQGTYEQYKATRISAETGGNLVYARVLLKDFGITRTDSDYGWAVFRDNTPNEPAFTPTDFDQLTQDVPETDATDVSFAGGLTGYGSRVSWVGGWGGLVRSTPVVPVNPTQYGTPAQLGGFGIQDLGVGPGARSVMMARVAGLDIRDSGSSASAQAVASDSNTEDEWNTRPSTVRTACDKTTTRMGQASTPCGPEPSPSPSPSPTPTTINEALAAGSSQLGPWPWESTTCLNSGDGPGLDPKPVDQTGGHSDVSCSSLQNKTTAETEFDAVHLPVGTGAVVDVASSYFKGVTARDKELGTVSEGFARASGIRIATDSVTISIAEATESVRAVAHGRHKTSSIKVERALSGVVIEQKGSAPQRPGACVNEACNDTLRTINRLISEFARVQMPQGAAVASNKGAFAGYEKTPAQYFNDLTALDDETKAVPALEIVVYADSEQKSRVRLQLAAIEATAIYTIGAPGAFDVDDLGSGPGTEVSPFGPVSNDSGGATGVPSADQGSRLIPHSIGEALVGVAGFMLRSPGQAFHFALVLLLLAGAGTSIARRRRVSVILEGSNGSH